MKPTKTKQQQIEELQSEIALLQNQLDQISKIPDKWEPPGGSFYINRWGEINATNSEGISRDFGAEFTTIKAADSAIKYKRFHNWMLCLAAYLNPNGKVGGEWGVYMAHSNSDISFRASQIDPAIYKNHPEGLFATEKIAKQAAEIMNRDGWKVK